MLFITLNRKILKFLENWDIPDILEKIISCR